MGGDREAEMMAMEEWLGELVRKRVQEKGESAVLKRDELRGMSQTEELKDHVPVMLVVDQLLSGEECVGNDKDVGGSDDLLMVSVFVG
ncbi:hypothetical protein F0562_011999 [Nyssa sinensis]|uniref:Uncharacterized protein n=1 Tax=Nyssa sinensis TaxID=561372 RepID=A0A5J4ZU16_9ASTE|nr:hypothetical protein F0562_011999 [Nyssa sinensis]